MVYFVKKLSLFLVIVSLIAIALFVAATILVRHKASFKLNSDTNAIVIGHSHPECAYNDSLINNFQNVAISGEAYFYTYPKIRNLVEENKNIATVFIELTNNQISESINEWVWSDKYISFHYVIYSPFIHWNDKLVVVKHNPKGFIANLPIVFKDMLKRTLAPSYVVPEVYGGYISHKGDLNDYLEKIKKQEGPGEDFVEINQETSIVQIQYLTKIVDYLKAQNVQVYLIRSPEHESYDGLRNEAIFQEVLKNHFADQYFLDLKDFPLGSESFRDPEHLNATGAKLLSIWMNELLASKFMQENYEQRHWQYNELNTLIRE